MNKHIELPALPAPRLPMDGVGTTWDKYSTRQMEDYARAAILADRAAQQRVLAERERQKSVEGWTPEHDDEHNNGELARAAACYVMPRWYSDPRINVPIDWPWDYSDWKPGVKHSPKTPKSPNARDAGRSPNRRSDLKKAGALIIAEIERLDRAASNSGGAAS